MGRKKKLVSAEDRQMGERIRRARERLNVSITDLGWAFGGKASSRQQVQFWERGENFPPASDLPRLCGLLRIDANHLLNVKPITTDTQRDIAIAQAALIGVVEQAKARSREGLARRVPSKSVSRIG